MVPINMCLWYLLTCSVFMVPINMQYVFGTY